MEGTVTITKDEYFRLCVDAEKLKRLECGGVDNWNWYGESLNPDGEPSFEEYENRLMKEIEAKS